jgi:uncharacterized protein (TIGR03437 family)
MTVTPGPVAPTRPLDPSTEIPFPTNLPTQGGPVTLTRPVAAVSVVASESFARFTQPVRVNQNTVATDAGIVEMVDVRTGSTMRFAPSLEGPLAAVTGNQRMNINGRTMAVDAGGATAYVLSASGLTIVPLTPVRPDERPQVTANGVVNTASYLPAVAPGSLISIFGRGLGNSATHTSAPLPTVSGGACVTLNNTPLPLILTSPTQINAQLPPTLAAGRYPLIVRSLDRQAASVATQVTVSRFAPAIFLDQQGRPAIYHADGRLVTKEAPARRDERLVMYATGFGATRGPRVIAGEAAPQNAIAERTQVFFGNPGYRQAEMIVEWSGLIPGMIGVNQVNLYVPGDRLRGEALPVTIRIGGVNSPSTGPAVPKVAVE